MTDTERADDGNAGTLGLRLRFLSGGCYGMAIALHERTGWQIGCLSVVWAHARNPEMAYRSVAHACVIRPDGMLVDAAGISSEADLRRRYLEKDHLTIESASFVEVGTPEGMLELLAAEYPAAFVEEALSSVEDARAAVDRLGIDEALAFSEPSGP